MHFLWSYFPVFYILPFLIATSRFEQFSGPSELLRWIVLAGGCAIGFSVGLKRAGMRPGRLTLADWMMGAFLIFFLASYSWSIDPTYTLLRSFSLVLLYGCSMWTLWSYADEFSEERLLDLFIWTIGAAMTINLVVGAILIPEELLAGRFQGLLYNPNNVGLVTGITIPLAVGRWIQTQRMVEVGVVVALAANLAVCGTRSAILGAGIGCLLLLVSLFRNRPTLAISLVLVLGFGGYAFTQTAFFEDRILREETLDTGSNRTEFWELGVDYTDRQPDWGHGFGTDALIHEFYGVTLSDLKLRGYGVMSSYHGLAVQIGRPMTYLFFGSLWAFVVWCIVIPRGYFSAVAPAAVIASGLIICVFESAIYSAGNCFAFIFWFAFMLAVRRVHYYQRGVRFRTAAFENQRLSAPESLYSRLSSPLAAMARPEAVHFK